MLTLYGLKTCDTCRKARQSAENAGKELTFIDVRQSPQTPEKLTQFLGEFGDALINRKSTTWRGLSEEERGQSPEILLAAHPTLMKRPVIEGETLTLGWSAEVEKAHLG